MTLDTSMNFSVFRDINEVEQGHVKDVAWVVDRIRNGASADLIQRIRALTDKKQRDILKKGLMSICWSGTFRRRADQHLIDHSGLVCIDFDHVPDMDALRARLTADQYTHVLFTSPSGDGLKVVVRIPANAKTHKGSFQALMDYYNVEQFDPKNSNLSRVCYESHDPDIHYNPASTIFEVVVEDREYDHSIERPLIRLESEDAIVANLIKWHQRKYPIIAGQRNQNSFILARAFNKFGVSKLTATQVLLQVQQEGFDREEIEQVVENAYKYTDEWNTRSFEDRYTVSFIRERALFGDSPAEIEKGVATRITDPSIRAKAVQEVMGQIDGCQFWSKLKNGSVIIHDHKLKAFLQDSGYRKLYPADSKGFVFVHVSRNLVHITSEKLIKDYVLRYVANVGDMAVYDKLATTTRLFKEEYLSMLDPITLAFAEDTKDYCNLYYRNACIRVYRDGIEVIDYANLGGYIWADQVIQRDFVEGVHGNGEFSKFVMLVSGKNQGRYDAHRSALGYLMHGFKDLSNNRAIIYNDSTMTDNPNGGTGKGIMVQAMRAMKRVVELDGKAFSFDKGFPYQTVNADTQILVFDDVQRYFQMERLFSIITEGITLEKKNKDAIKLPVQKSPKIVITTNYTIQGEGSSHERRRWEVEMSDYFKVNHTPKDEFGHQLFLDWTEVEWQRFDAFMVNCVITYLEQGLLTAEWVNLGNRKFAGKTDFDFFEWAQDGDKLPLDTRIYKTNKLEEFMQEYSDYGPRGKKTLTGKRWAMWLDAYAKHRGWASMHGHDLQGRYVVFKTTKTEDVPVTTDANPF
jgi:hypothetical protein